MLLKPALNLRACPFTQRSFTNAEPADLYIIDEPLANLDPESRDTAINLILGKTNGKTLVLVMHGSEEYHTLFAA
ncbi:MAG: hypothetical protein LC794_00545 [Acidobacteria bacterium]|nr:hypothetical protein [Acidobacteriota bacterium]